MDSTAAKAGHPRTHLFMIRIWREGTGAAESELRMQVQHVMSGEIHFFREWEALTIYLHDKVDRLEDETCDDAGGA